MSSNSNAFQKNAEIFSIEIPLTNVKVVKKTGKIKSKDISGGVYLGCKDLRNYVFAFTSSSNLKSAQEFILSSSNPKTLLSTFAFFYQPNFEFPVNGWLLYDIHKEFARQGISWEKWRISPVNRNFGISESYPPSVIVEHSIQDEEITASSKLRTDSRWVVYTWGWKKNSAFILRVGSPRFKESEKKRSKEAEKRLANLRSTESKILEVCLKANPNHGEKLTIFDMGTPQNWHAPLIPIGSFKYKNCPSNNNIEEVFTKMEEGILSYQRLSANSFHQEAWLQLIQSHLTTVLSIVQSIQNGESILIQESPNCDAAFVVSTLAQLCLDPYYRTIEGFAVLIEKEWLSLGYPFSRKTGFLSAKKTEKEEIVPTFLIFLDCLWQLWRQFPTCFEFNEDFITFVVRHLYSCKFGTFIGNNEKERFYTLLSKTKTISLWTQVFVERKRFLNSFFLNDTEQVLYPVCHQVIYYASYYLWWDQIVMRFQRKIRQFFDKTVQQGSKKLRLNNRQLSVLLNDARLSALIVFDISENEFTSIPTMILFLENLKELSIANNLIRFVPNGFWSLVNSKLKFLEQLDLKGNHLEELPESMAETSSLKILYLG